MKHSIQKNNLYQPQNQSYPDTILVFFYIVLIASIDLVSKYSITQVLTQITTPSLTPEYFFNLQLTQNHGFVGGFLASSEYAMFYTTIIPTLAILWIAYLVIKTKEHILSHYGAIMILGGAFGNLIDRLYNGFITDFIVIPILSRITTIINLADTIISL